MLVGQTGTAALTVAREHLAVAVGSGDAEVFSTPWLVALMEQAIWGGVVVGGALRGDDCSIVTAQVRLHVIA